MLLENSRVVAVDQDGLWVEIDKSSPCGKCVAKYACAHGLSQAALEKKSLNKNTLDTHRGFRNVRIKAFFSKNEAAEAGATEVETMEGKVWSIGDIVVIGIKENAFLVVSLLTFLFPLGLMLAFVYFAAVFTSASEFASVVFAVLGIVLGAYIVRKVAYGLQNSQHAFLLRFAKGLRITVVGRPGN